MLSDGQKRAAYDQYGHAGVDPNMGGAGAQGFGGFADAFGDIFGDIFGQAAGGARAAAVAARRCIAAPTCATAWKSRSSRPHTATTRRSACRAGCRARFATGRCEARHEAGNLPDLSRQHGAHVAGLLQHPADLPEVPRHGHLHSRAVRALPRVGQGEGNQDARSEDPGRDRRRMRIRSAGNGEPGINGGPPGDLYVEIHIKPHSVFERDGDDLHCQMPIPATTAALGGEIEVPTLAGRASFPVPEGTQSGKTFACAARASRGCVRASRAICTSTCRSRRR